MKVLVDAVLALALLSLALCDGSQSTSVVRHNEHSAPSWGGCPACKNLRGVDAAETFILPAAVALSDNADASRGAESTARRALLQAAGNRLKGMPPPMPAPNMPPPNNADAGNVTSPPLPAPANAIETPAAPPDGVQADNEGAKLIPSTPEPGPPRQQNDNRVSMTIAMIIVGLFAVLLLGALLSYWINHRCCSGKRPMKSFFARPVHEYAVTFTVPTPRESKPVDGAAPVEHALRLSLSGLSSKVGSDHFKGRRASNPKLPMSGYSGDFSSIDTWDLHFPVAPPSMCVDNFSQGPSLPRLPSAAGRSNKARRESTDVSLDNPTLSGASGTFHDCSDSGLYSRTFSTARSLTGLSARSLAPSPMDVVPELVRPPDAPISMVSNSVYRVATHVYEGDNPSLEDSMNAFGPLSTSHGCSEASGPTVSIETQLDDLVLYGNSILLSKFRLLGPQERRHGRHHIVQFASSAKNTEDIAHAAQFAVTFFKSRKNFENVRYLYNDKRLLAALPKVEAIVSNDDGKIRDPFGRSLPPFIVMERGEPLDDWIRHQQPDTVTSMEALIHIVDNVMGLHSAGLVHRNLKPSNIMWMRRQSKWVVVDFGDAALSGQRMALDPRSLLVYDAPEVVTAKLANKRTIMADRTVDVWALGVIAYETLTKTRVFERNDVKKILNAVVGKGKLPWEDAERNRSQMRQLGFMREGILLMLKRDPESRPRLNVLYQVWRRLMLKVIITRRRPA